MAILRCTKKLLDEIKTKPAEDPGQDEFGSWHCNLLRIERRKCVLFTHDRTRFSFLVPGLTAPDFKCFEDVFRESLFRNLLAEGILQKQIELFLENNRRVEIAKTNSRSVLGSMNDMTFQLKYKIQYDGGLLYTDLGLLNCELNRIPMSFLEETYSRDEFRKFLGIPIR